MPIMCVSVCVLHQTELFGGLCLLGAVTLDLMEKHTHTHTHTVSHPWW